MSGDLPRATAPEERLPVLVLGATGTVGQRLVLLLDEHPWLEPVGLVASERSTGRPYGEVVRWMQSAPCPEWAARLPVLSLEELPEAPVVLSALDARTAREVEEDLAREGRLVVSNASAHRMTPGVPLVVPEVNPDHLELLAHQPYGAGGLVTNPNCSTIGLVLALAPLERAFGVERAHVVTQQALSGAGLAGPGALEAQDNVIPWIAGEEEKLETETRRILGRVLVEGSGADVEPCAARVSASCSRVPVSDGHLLHVSLGLRERASADQLREAWTSFRGAPQELDLPSAPERPLAVHDAPDAPQPRLHRDLGRGMTVSIGGLRPCPLLDWKLTVLVHNTVRGAAGGALLLTELVLATRDGS